MNYMVLNDHAIPRGGADKVAIEQYEFLKEKYRSQSGDMITIDKLCGSEYKFTARNSIRDSFIFEPVYRLRLIVYKKILRFCCYTKFQITVHNCFSGIDKNSGHRREFLSALLGC